MDLREISHGHWEGLTRKDVEEHFTEEYTAVGIRPVHVRATGRRIWHQRSGTRPACDPRDRGQS